MANRVNPRRAGQRRRAEHAPDLYKSYTRLHHVRRERIGAESIDAVLRAHGLLLTHTRGGV